MEEWICTMKGFLWRDVYTVVQPSQWSDSSLFSSPQSKILCSLSVTPHSPLLPDPSDQLSTFYISTISIKLSILDAVDKWNHTICGIVCLVLSLRIILSKFLCVSCISTAFLFLAEKYSTVWIYYILFIHSLIDWHLSVSISIFCRLWVILLWTFVYKFLCGHMFSFLQEWNFWIIW